jgi:hypothetical protein
MGVTDKTQRFNNGDGTHTAAPAPGVEQARSYTRLEQYVNLQKPPEPKPAAVEVQAVQAVQDPRVAVIVGNTDGTGGGGWSIVTVQLDPTSTHSYHVYGEVTTPARRVQQSFDGAAVNGQLFTKAVPLPAGTYRLVVVVKDLTNGDAKTSEMPFQVN